MAVADHKLPYLSETFLEFDQLPIGRVVSVFTKFSCEYPPLTERQHFRKALFFGIIPHTFLFL